MAISLEILLFFSTSLFLILNYRNFLILDFLRMKMLANLALNPILLFVCQIVTLLVVNLCFSSISQCAVDFHKR